MAPTSHTSHADLHAAMGFLDAFAAQTTNAPDGPGPSSAAPALTDEEIDALARHTEAFLRSPRGQVLMSELQADFLRLASFADAEGLGTAAREIRAFCQALPYQRERVDYWMELLIAGRHDLAELARGITDARVPLDERRTLLVDLAKGLAHCGLRIRVELQQACQRLIGFQGALPQTVRRAFERQVEDVIHRLVGERGREDPVRHALDVHFLADIQQGLALKPAAWGGAARSSPRFIELIDACRRELTAKVTPNALSMVLAAEALEAVRAGLHALAGDALNLGENRQHLNRLQRLVGDLSSRYGPLRAESFVELDDEALPQLTRDPTLIALDIRRGMASHGVAGPVFLDEVLTLGARENRLALHAADGDFCHVLLGDPSLNERHALRPEHLQRIVAEQPPQWHAEAPETARWPAALRRSLLDAHAQAMGRHEFRQVSPNWLDDEETARRFGARMDDRAFVDYLTTAVRTPLSDTGLAALMHLATDRRHPEAMLQRIANTAPTLPARMWSSFGTPWLHAALACGKIAQTHLLMTLLTQALPHLPPASRLSALSLPDLSTDQSLATLGVMQRYLNLLATCAEQAQVTRSEVDALLGQGVVARMVRAQFDEAHTPLLLLPPLGQLCRLGLVSSDRLLSLTTLSSPEGVPVPVMLRALAHPYSDAVRTYMRWVFDHVGDGIPSDCVTALLAPRLTADEMSSRLQTLQARDDPSSLVDYLRGLLQAHQAGWVPQDRVTQLLHLRIRDANDQPVPLLVQSLQGLGQTTTVALLDWMKEAVAADALNGEELLRLLNAVDRRQRTLLGTAIAGDLQASVRSCASLLVQAMSRGVLGQDAMSQVMRAAVNGGQATATDAHAPREQMGVMAVRMRHPAQRSPQPVLELLWDQLLPSVARGHWRATRVSNLLTGRHGDQLAVTATPQALLMGAYEHLVKAVLDRRLRSGPIGLPPVPPHERVPVKDPSRLSDELLMTLLIGRSGPLATPALSVVSQGGASERVGQVMGMGLQHFRQKRLTREELALWWGATDDQGLTVLHTALRSQDLATLTAILKHLLEAMQLPVAASPDIDLRTGQNTPATSPSQAQVMDGPTSGAQAAESDPVAALFGAPSADGVTPAQEAVRLGNRDLLHAYINGLWAAQQFEMVSERQLVTWLRSEPPERAATATATAPALSRAQASCRALLEEHFDLALALGGGLE